MRLFDDEESRGARSGGDWQQHRAHRSAGSGPPQDEVGVLALASFVLVRTDEVTVAVRGVTAYSDGLRLSVVVLFADEQRAEDLDWALRDYSRSPGRFRVGCAFADGRRVTTGRSESPEVERPGDVTPHLVLLSSNATALTWTGEYWLWPLPPDGPLVLGCRWPDRRIPETLAQLDAGPLLAAAAASTPVWESGG
ncbi:MAG TPA: hypothetical protein VM433_07860 [Mycobacteriales bacterium]|nr:hypothetical protein [Mycobacteriales bacterium]